MEAEESQVFARLRMDGERFRQHKLPVNALIEIQRYQRLIIALAQTRWKLDNPNRSAPSRLASDFQLTIARLEDGSTTPVLERLGTISQFEEYYDEAEDTLEEAFQSLVQGASLPTSFDWAASKDFKDFGDSLYADELVEFRPESVTPIVYSAEVRSEVLPRLTRIRSTEFLSSNFIERAGAVPGRLFSLNAETKTFRLRPLGSSARAISGTYAREGLTADLRRVLDSQSDAPIIRIEGLVRYNTNHELLRVLNAVSVELFEVGGMPSSSRLIELTALEDGWADGHGLRTQFAALDAARDIVRAFHDAQRRVPGIFPTVEGGVLLEWPTPQKVVNVEVGPDGDFLLFVNEIANANVVEYETDNSLQALAFLMEHVNE